MPESFDFIEKTLCESISLICFHCSSLISYLLTDISVFSVASVIYFLLFVPLSVLKYNDFYDL